MGACLVSGSLEEAVAAPRGKLSWADPAIDPRICKAISIKRVLVLWPAKGWLPAILRRGPDQAAT